jgi:hypothetical protein
MGYRLEKLSRGYLPVPHILFEDKYKELEPSECKLLMYLYHAMQRASSPCIRTSGTSLTLSLGMDSKTIRAARVGLESKGYIRCNRAAKAGAAYEYHLLNPENGEPFPPEVRRSPVADYPGRTKADDNFPGNEEHQAAHGPDKKCSLERSSACAKRAAMRRKEQSFLPEHKRKGKHVCPKHPGALFYSDFNEEKWYCEKCRPNRYLPPGDHSSETVQSGCVPPSAEEIFGRT